MKGLRPAGGSRRGVPHGLREHLLPGRAERGGRAAATLLLRPGGGGGRLRRRGRRSGTSSGLAGALSWRRGGVWLPIAALGGRAALQRG